MSTPPSLFCLSSDGLALLPQHTGARDLRTAGRGVQMLPGSGQSSQSKDTEAEAAKGEALSPETSLPTLKCCKLFVHE